jgi:hypothetical protein
LPQPDSPVTRTVASVGATFSIIEYTAIIAEEPPYSWPNLPTAGREAARVRAIVPMSTTLSNGDATEGSVMDRPSASIAFMKASLRGRRNAGHPTGDRQSE